MLRRTFVEFAIWDTKWMLLRIYKEGTGKYD